MSVNLTEESLEQKIVEINKALNEIKNAQKYLAVMEHKNNGVLMKKICKLQEYNEISDMTNQIFEKRISNIEYTLNELVKRLSA